MFEEKYRLLIINVDFLALCEGSIDMIEEEGKYSYLPSPNVLSQTQQQICGRSAFL